MYLENNVVTKTSIEHLLVQNLTKFFIVSVLAESLDMRVFEEVEIIREILRWTKVWEKRLKRFNSSFSKSRFVTTSTIFLNMTMIKYSMSMRRTWIIVVVEVMVGVLLVFVLANAWNKDHLFWLLWLYWSTLFIELNDQILTSWYQVACKRSNITQQMTNMFKWIYIPLGLFKTF